MRLFVFITLLSLALFVYSQSLAPAKGAYHRPLPTLIQDEYSHFKKSFQHPQNANVLWALLTGQKIHLSPQVKKKFSDLQLSFLFSPSGLHLFSLLIVFFYFIKKIKFKRLKIGYFYQACFFILAIIFPYVAMKRLAIFRLLMLLKNFFNNKISIDYLFLITFFISFLMGHFKQSPLGFIFSFLYMGTFIALRDRSRITIFMAIMSNHLMTCLFFDQQLSLLSLLINIPLIALFSFFLPFFYLYLISFRLIPFNWAEPLIGHLMILIHWSAKCIQGTFLNSSPFLILAIWMILLKRQKKYIALFLFLHENILL